MPTTLRQSYFSFITLLSKPRSALTDAAAALSHSETATTWTHLVEEIELLVQRGADLHQAGRVGLRLVGADGSDPDVAQVGDVQGAVGGHSQRGGRLEAGVAGVAAITWWGHREETGGS